MMKRSAMALILILAGCGTENPQTNAGAEAPATKASGLTGLYEGGTGERRDRMCIIDRGPGNVSFGLVTWGGGDHNCSGTGAAVREGGSLRLNMAGDEACVIEARIEGGRIILPAAAPEGCAYYCGARATLANVAFEKVGATAEDAMRATDLVGEPLCGGS